MFFINDSIKHFILFIILNIKGCILRKLRTLDLSLSSTPCIVIVIYKHYYDILSYVKLFPACVRPILAYAGKSFAVVRPGFTPFKVVTKCVKTIFACVGTCLSYARTGFAFLRPNLTTVRIDPACAGTTFTHSGIRNTSKNML